MARRERETHASRAAKTKCASHENKEHGSKEWRGGQARKRLERSGAKLKRDRSRNEKEKEKKKKKKKKGSHGAG